MSNNVPDSMMLNNVSDSMMSNNVPDSMMSNNVPDSMMPNNVLDSMMSNNVPVVMMSNNVSNTMMSNNVSDTIMSNNVSDTMMFNNVSDTMMPNNVLDSRMSNNVSDFMMSNNVPDTMMSNNVPEVMMSNNVSDAMMSDTMMSSNVSDAMMSYNVSDSIKMINETSKSSTYNILGPVVISVSFIYILFGFVVILALKRTKTIPPMAKFLAMSLLCSYELLAVLYVIRRILDYINIELVLLITVFVIAASFTRYTIIAMLAIDRVMVIQFPFAYRHILASSKVKIVPVIIWIAVHCMIVVPMTIKCNLTVITGEFGVKYSCFVKSSAPLTMPIIGLVLIISIVSFVIVISKVCNMTNGRHNQNITGLYKTTIANFVNIINNFFNITALIIALLFQKSFYDVLLLYEALTFVSALVDMVIYAIWFMECRLEFVKMAVVFFPKLEQYKERLRYPTFNVVVRNELPMTKVEKIDKITVFREAKASKGMHPVCNENSPDHHLSLHPR